MEVHREFQKVFSFTGTYRNNNILTYRLKMYNLSSVV